MLMVSRATRAGLRDILGMFVVYGRLFVTAVLVASNLPTSAATAQAVLPALLEPLPEHIAPSGNHLRYVRLNTNLLSFEVAKQINAGHAQRLILNISDREGYLVELNKVSISSPTQYLITGVLPDVPEGQFLATYFDKAFAVNVFMGPRSLKIEQRSPDVYALIEVNLDRSNGLDIGPNGNTPIARQGSGRVSENIENLAGMNDAQLRELIKHAQQALQERSAKRLDELRQLAKEAGYEVTLRKIREKKVRRRPCHCARSG